MISIFQQLSKDEWLPGDLIASIQLCDVASTTKRKSATLQLTAKLKKNLISRKVLNKCFIESCYLLEHHHLRLCKIAQSLVSIFSSNNFFTNHFFSYGAQIEL